MKSVAEQIFERLPIGTLSQSEKEHYKSIFVEQLSAAYSNGRIEGINGLTGIPSKYRGPEDYYKAIYGDLPQKLDASKLFKKNEDNNL